jgi:hypothetical protein
VFRTDNNEECWKLTSVKKEVAEEDVSLDEPAGHSDSSDDQRYDYNIPFRYIGSEFNILENYLLKSPISSCSEKLVNAYATTHQLCQLNNLCVFEM